MQFVDVQPSNWYYNEVVEAANLYMEDGDAFVQGIPYNGFEPGKPFAYFEIPIAEPVDSVTVPIGITMSADNPVFIYVDGIQTVYKDIKTTGESSTIELYFKVGAGSTVTVASYGVPQLDEFKRPIGPNLTDLRYPNAKLVGVDNYTYRPFVRNKRERVVVLGKEMVRADIPQSVWDRYPNDRQRILKEYIGYSDDKYYLAKDAVLHLPFHMNNVSAHVSYLTDEGGWVKQNYRTVHCTSNNVVYTNRVFPNANITRAEAYTLMNRLRKTLYARFTDTKAATYDMEVHSTSYLGQTVISTQGRYNPRRNELKVRIDGRRMWEGYDYDEVDQYTIELYKPLPKGLDIEIEYRRYQSDILEDVGHITYLKRIDTGQIIKVNGRVDYRDPKDNSWWAGHILDMENEIYEGKNIIEGISVGGSAGSTGIVEVGPEMDPVYTGGSSGSRWFLPQTFLTRAHAATALNRFRKMIIERFI